MKQSKTCPICAKEIQADALQCHSCGSSLENPASAAQHDAQQEKTFGRSVLYFMKIVAAATLLFCLEKLMQKLLPEEARQWLDWFVGDTSKGLSPARMLVYTVFIVGFFVLWRLDRRNSKDR